MITRDQAIRGDVFVAIDRVTGETCYWYAQTATEKRNNRPKRPREFRRSGKTKTWKRDPDRWEIPTKFGYKESQTIRDRMTVSFELLDQYLARQRYGFGPDTPVGIIADRLKDDGEDAWADRVLCLPKVTV